MTAPRLTAIADDLTGAADCAGSCRHWDIATCIRFGVDAGADDPGACLIFDINSRNMPKTGAVRRALEAYRHARRPGTTLYHKFDTLLRGNWADEIGAVRDQFGWAGSPLIVAPAYPELGRGTRQAAMVIRNQRRAELHVATRLRDAGLLVEEIELSDIRSENDLLQARFDGAAGRVDAIVCDAETRADLDRVARAGQATGAVHWAGSGGLIRSLVPLLQLPLIEGGRPRDPQGPALILVGSLSDTACAQAAALAGAGLAEWQSIAPDAPPRSDAFQVIEACIAAGQNVLVTTDRAGPGTVQDPSVAKAVARALVPAAAKAAKLILVGGSTARALLDALDINVLNVEGETEPGVTIATGTRASGPVTIVLKPGDFGTPASLVNALRGLRKREN